MIGWRRSSSVERWTKAEARRLDNRRRAILAELEWRGWSVGPTPTHIEWGATIVLPPGVAGGGENVDWRMALIPVTLVSERQARNLETSLRLIGPYPREERR